MGYSATRKLYAKVSSVRAEASARPMGLPKLATVYKAAPAPGGKICIYGVPIFAEHSRTFEDGPELHFGLAWLKQACLHIRSRADEGYTPPVHLGHHDFKTTDERPSVGTFVAPRLARMLFEDQAKWLLFVDLLIDEDEIETVKKYPYRSAEILDYTRPPEIDSLALLTSRVPYFRLPNLNLDESALKRATYATPIGSRGVAISFPDPLQLDEFTGGFQCPVRMPRR